MQAEPTQAELSEVRAALVSGKKSLMVVFHNRSAQVRASAPSAWLWLPLALLGALPAPLYLIYKYTLSLLSSKDESLGAGTGAGGGVALASLTTAGGSSGGIYSISSYLVD